MANEFFDIAFGKFVGLAEKAIAASNDQVVLLLLRTVEVDNTLRVHVNVADLLVAAGNVEADCTNYARKTGIAVTINTAVTRQRDVDIPDQLFVALGGTVDNDMEKLLIAFQNDPGGVNDDTTLIPITYYNYLLKTDGSDVLIEVHADGITRSGQCP